MSLCYLTTELHIEGTELHRGKELKNNQYNPKRIKRNYDYTIKRMILMFYFLISPILTSLVFKNKRFEITIDYFTSL